ncbi:MAG: hypothetical protein V3U37_07615 [Nitrospinaceae bacterium]
MMLALFPGCVKKNIGSGKAASGAWMVPVVDLAHPLFEDVGIDLDGRFLK